MERFIVGTGRCGSTLLSRMLAESSEVLSLFEFFNGLDMARRFGPETLSGIEFAELISSEQPFVTAVLRRGYRVDEITYPFDASVKASTEAARVRRRPEDPLPWILVSTLPRLSSDPDQLFEEVMAFAQGLPQQRPSAHYLDLFAWLGHKLDRPLWIERSGSSIDYVGSLIEEFPGARIVHIVRDGPEVALSMREHHAYRLPISLMYDVVLSGGKRVSEHPPLDLHAVPDASDTISQILSSRPPAADFGRYWSDQIVRGFTGLRAIDRERFMQVRFEDLVRHPRRELTRIADFFFMAVRRGGGGKGDWLARASRLVRGVPTLRRPHLSDIDGQELDVACEPGRRMLAGE